MRSEPFDFQIEGQHLSGRIDIPLKREAEAIVILVHGYGETNIVDWNSYLELRRLFASVGIASVIWDKPGCGDSESTFDINQPVESSANEVIQAARTIRERRLPGYERIGLWGISRTGWIVPIAMQKQPGFSFWISVSGVDDKESFGYFLHSNVIINGQSTEYADQILEEWHRGNEIIATGGSFDEYLDATTALRHDPCMIEMTGSPDRTKHEFEREQRRFESGDAAWDQQSRLMVYVPAFREMLSSLDVPVLAIFGERDMNVDWRKTRQL